jgi:type IV secretory pathway TrbL component
VTGGLQPPAQSAAKPPLPKRFHHRRAAGLGERMKRSQQMTHGVQAAAHAVRSGDSHGGGSSVNLSESD